MFVAALMTAGLIGLGAVPHAADTLDRAEAHRATLDVNDGERLADHLNHGPRDPRLADHLRADAAQKSGTKKIKVDLLYDGDIVHLVVNEDGIPCEVTVVGDVLDKHGDDIGDFTAVFEECPDIAPIPEELGDNAFGIPVGTQMPRWQGEVIYDIDGQGVIFTWEDAWIFPTDPADPASPLAVLSVADVTGGTERFCGATGQIITPDGYDGQGALLGQIRVPK